MKNKIFLLSQLVRRDLFSRYAGSLGGAWWAVIHPAVLCVLYGFVFGTILKISPPTGFPGGFMEFLLGGLLPWVGFQEAVVRGSGAVVDQAHLVRKLAFPVELLVVAGLASALVLEAVALAVLMAWTVLLRGWRPDPFLLLTGFAFEALLLVGPVFALAALTVYFRDISQLLGPALMVAFYLTPVIYPASMVPGRLAPLVDANPLALLVALFRSGLFGTPAPPWVAIAGWGALSVVLAFVGTAFFRRCRMGFADLL